MIFVNWAMRFICDFCKTIIFLLLASVAFVAQGQEVATLKGRVTDAQGHSLQYANVMAVSLNPVRGCVTDAKGRFSLTLPPDSMVTIRVQMSSYITIDTLLKVAAGKTKEIRVTMKGTSVRLDKVTIAEEKSRSTTFTRVDVQRLESSVGPQSGVESLLKTLPDVNSNNEMSTQYSVRGGSFDENLVYINDVEVFRPMLIRNGQQEGTSIINPDMVKNILFSPGGFNATYGDRMASVLDIQYGRPQEFKAKASASFLGASLWAEGLVGEKFTYSVGFRQHSNRYIFRTLDTKGNYTTSYTDLQALLTYTVSEALDLQLLTIATRNRYGLVPEEQTTTFGGFSEVMQFEVYYEGEEQDSYRTLLGSLSADWHPNDDFKLRWTNSFQSNKETEQYDILSQFMLYELNVGNVDENGQQERFDRGIGSFLEHARNYLITNIYSTELRGTHYAELGNWNWGLKFQYEQMRDRMREWKLVDSAGYAIPTVIPEAGGDSNMPNTPVLQLFCRANHTIGTARVTAFVQRNWDFFTDRGDVFSLVTGIRGQWYSIDFNNDNLSGNNSNYQHETLFDVTSKYNRGFLFSPRISLNYKPKWEKDILFRLAAGVYSQAPFYREYRFDDGTLNHAILSQKSYQAMGTMDWNFHIGTSPFKFTADLYYKYIDDLIPYRIENLRVRYDAVNNAVGYTTGLSLRLSGEVVEGLESWTSLSLMRTRQDIEGDQYGWLPRPTDQLVSFKIFFQDYIPTVPFWRMSLNFIVASGLPFSFPQQKNFSHQYTYPAYFRVDWGNTIQLSRIEKLKDTWIMKHFADLLLSVDVFNLFDYKNVVSYTFVSDYNNIYYPVPNYLTARQINFKLTAVF